MGVDGLPEKLIDELRRRDAAPLGLRPLERARLAEAGARRFRRRRPLGLGVAAAAAVALLVWLAVPMSDPLDLNADGTVDIVDAMLLARGGDAAAGDALAWRVVQIGGEP